MKTNAKKRFLSWIIAFLMVFTYMPAAAFATDTENVDAAAPATASAGTEAEISVLDGQVLITNSKGTGALDGDIVTITAAGAFPGQPTANVVNIYNKSGKTATLSFDYVAENYRDDKEGGFSEELDDSTYTILLEPDEYATLSITGKRSMSDNVAVLTLSNFNLEFAADTSDVTFSYAESLGSVKAAGEIVAPGGVKSIAYQEGAVIEAVPADGIEFLGWINKDTGKIISSEATYTLKPTKNMNVEAAFSGKDSKTYYLVGGQFLIDDFDQATAKALTLAKKTVVLMKDTTFAAGNYVVPAGVTFLIPYNKDNTLFTEPSGDCGMAVWGTFHEPVPYRTLTLADGAKLIINGKVSLSAQHFAANGGARASASPAGPVSYLDLEKGSAVTVNNGGILYAYGYIVGDGKVTAKNGSTVYELFQVEDFRGGGASATMAMNNLDKGVLPMSQYYVQNIEVPLTLEAGAVEYVYASFFMTQASLGASVPFIGGPKAMFHLSDGHVTKSYDGSTDRLVVDVDGTMSLSPITVEVSGNTLNSGQFDLPINSNISVNINSGNVTINQDIAMLPGAEIAIEEGALCTLGDGINIFVYDADQWGKYCGTHNELFIPLSFAPGRTYNRTADDLVDAAVKVNGKLDATKGNLYTTTDAELSGGHANIYSTASGVVELIPGEQKCTYQFSQTDTEGTFHEIYLLPANLKNADGSFVQTNGGKFTYVDIAWQCDHAVISEEVIQPAACEEAGIKLVTCEQGHEYKAVIPATGHTEVIDPAVEGSCTVDAKTEGSHCGVCGKVLKKQTITIAPGHTEIVIKGTPATCTEGGISDGRYCFVCNEVLAKQEILDPLGHNWAVEGTEPTCTLAGFGSSVCSRCGDSVEDSVIPALGHNYDWETLKDPDCEDSGIRTGKCTREDCGHEAMELIAPTGHDTVKTDRVEATCDTAGHGQYWTCNICSSIFEDEDSAVELAGIPVINALGHSPEKTGAVKATCTKDGSTEYWTCHECDGMFADAECTKPIADIPVITASGHAASKVDAAAATCTEDGHDEYWECGACGGLFADAECTTPIKDIPVIGAYGHKAVKHAAEAATCTEDGHEDYWTCSECGGIFANESCRIKLDAVPVITATGHKAVKKAAVAATCTKDGLKEHWACNECGRLFADAACAVELTAAPEITATGHHLVKTEAVAPSCTEEGFAAYWTCSVCGSIFEDENGAVELAAVPAIKATGHSYGEEQYREPSAESDGGWFRVCAACGHEDWTKVQTYNELIAEQVADTKLKASATASQKTETITVTWTETSDTYMTYYEVYRSKSGKAGSFGKIGEATAQKYVDKTAKAGTTYYYKVRGVRVVGEKEFRTNWSNAPSAKIKKVTAAYVKESQMTIRSYYAGNAIKVTWTSPRVKVDGYEIWRSKTANGKYTKIKTTGTSARQWTNKGLKLQSRWYYKVRGYKVVDGKKVYTQFSKKGYRYVLNAKNAKLANAIDKSDSITALKAVKANGGIKVTWTKDTDVKCNRYEVWRSTAKNGTYTKIAVTSNKFYNDKSTLKSGKRYYYKIVGFRWFGKACPQTKPSNVVSAIK